MKVTSKTSSSSATESDPLMGENGEPAEPKNFADEDNMEKGSHGSRSIHSFYQQLSESLRRTGQTSQEEFDVRICDGFKYVP